MLIKSPLQTVINIVVIVLVVGALALGAAVTLPSKNPLGPLMGKFVSSKGNLSELLANLDPRELGKALAANPQMTGEILAALGEDGARVIAEAVNQNPEFISQMLDYLDPAVVADMVNSSGDFSAELTRHLDPQAVARVLNENGEWLTQLLGKLNPAVVAQAVNANGEFLTKSTAAMDPAVLAQAINGNGPFLTALIGYLDPAVLAGALNANSSMSSALLGYLDTAVVAQIINANGPFLASLIGLLDPAVLAAGTNANPTFLSRLMRYLDPKAVATAMNGNASSTRSLLNLLSNDLLLRILNVTVHDLGWLNSLLAGLDPIALAMNTNNHTTFPNRLLKYLDPQWVAAIANNNPTIVYYALNAIKDPAYLPTIAAIANNEALMKRVLPYINTSAIAGALGDNPTLISNLIPLVDNELVQRAVIAINNNDRLLDGIMQGTNPYALALALNTSNGNLIRNLIPHLSAATGEAIGQALVDDLKQPLSESFLKSLLKYQDGRVIAMALNNAVRDRPDFIQRVLEGLTPETAEKLAQAMNESPGTARTVASLLNADVGRAIALALNGLMNQPNADLILGNLLGGLSPEVGRAIAEGLNQGDPEFQKQMMANFTGALGTAIAQGINSNTALFNALLPRLNDKSAIAIAQGLNDGCINVDTQETFLEAMLSSSSPQFVQGISNVINTPPYNMDNFIKTLLANLDANAATAVAKAANVNPTFIEYILRNTDGRQMAETMNANPTFLENLIPLLDPNSLAHALNTALATPGGRSFVNGLLANLQGEVVATALNANPQLTQQLLTAAQSGGNDLGGKIAGILNEALVASPSNNLITTLLRNLNAGPMIDILNMAMDIETSGLPTSPYSSLKVLWMFIEFRASVLGLLNVYGRGWERFTRNEEFGGAFYPVAEEHHW